MSDNMNPEERLEMLEKSLVEEQKALVSYWKKVLKRRFEMKLTEKDKIRIDKLRGPHKEEFYFLFAIRTSDFIDDTWTIYVTYKESGAYFRCTENKTSPFNSAECISSAFCREKEALAKLHGLDIIYLEDLEEEKTNE